MSLIEASILIVIFSWAIYVVFRFFKKSGQGKCSGCESPGSRGKSMDQIGTLPEFK